jgi:hypothetical protein
MKKKDTVVIVIIFLFLVLNTAPFFEISCTEVNGVNHLESYFNRCCKTMQPSHNRRSEGSKEISINNSHCFCSVNLDSQKYLTTDYNKIITDFTLLTNRQIYPGFIYGKKVFATYISESPPYSINLIATSVFLI